MPRPPDATPRPPRDFAALLATKEPLFLVGGQAVNLWALYYRDHTVGLGPFVSLDADVLGDRDTLQSIADATGAKPQFFPLRPPTNEIGVVVPKDATGRSLLIEVLRYVHGASNDELSDPAYTMALDGATHVRVPGPIALLQAKVANVADLSQNERQDSRHVAILSRLMPGYLADLQAAALENRLAERRLIELLERLLNVLTSERGNKVFTQLKLGPLELFKGLGNEKLPKLAAFLEERLPRALRSS